MLAFANTISKKQMANEMVMTCYTMQIVRELEFLIINGFYYAEMISGGLSFKFRAGIFFKPVIGSVF